jgi:hypothetical protein
VLTVLLSTIPCPADAQYTYLLTELNKCAVCRAAAARSAHTCRCMGPCRCDVHAAEERSKAAAGSPCPVASPAFAVPGCLLRPRPVGRSPHQEPAPRACVCCAQVRPGVCAPGGCTRRRLPRRPPGQQNRLAGALPPGMRRPCCPGHSVLTPYSPTRPSMLSAALCLPRASRRAALPAACELQVYGGNLIVASGYKGDSGARAIASGAALPTQPAAAAATPRPAPASSLELPRLSNCPGCTVLLTRIPGGPPCRRR